MLTRYPCCMCGKPPVQIVVDGDFRVSVCAEHTSVTWEQWRAQRAVTHPARPPRRVEPVHWDA